MCFLHCTKYMEKHELWDAQRLASLEEVDEDEHDDDPTIVLG